MAGYALLLAYVAVLASGYALFVRLRSRSKRLAGPPPPPWFPTNVHRVAYYDAYNAMPDEMSTADVKVLRECLLRRTVENVARLITLREDRNPLAALLARGSVSDMLWSDYLAAESELDAEISACMTDAEELQPNWGRSIMQQAVQLYGREREVAQTERRRRIAEATMADTPSMLRIRDELARELSRSPSAATDKYPSNVAKPASAKPLSLVSSSQSPSAGSKPVSPKLQQAAPNKSPRSSSPSYKMQSASKTAASASASSPSPSSSAAAVLNGKSESKSSNSNKNKDKDKDKQNDSWSQFRKALAVKKS